MFAASKTASVSGGYQISRSLRFNSADSAGLSRTFASAGNRKTWTISFWTKKGFISTTEKGLFEQYSANTDAGFFYSSFESGANVDKLIISGGATVWRRTTAVYRDPSAWYHIVIAIDTTQATADNRIRLYVNGSEVTDFATKNNPTQNADLGFNQAVTGYFGRLGSGYYYDGYFTELNFVDGTQLTPSSFGETNAQTGVWQPKAYSGSYGTNGFYLNFSDNSNTTAATLGKDYSGNGNNWTPNNFSVTAGAGNDSLVDSPTSYGTDTGVGGTVRGNYCTFNAVDKGTSITLSNGNLDFVQSGAGSDCARATFAIPSSGKWYWETLVSAVGSGCNIGIATSTTSLTAGGAITGVLYQYSGYKSINSWSNDGSYGSAYTTNDLIGIAVDMDAGTITFYKNGSSLGAAYSSLSSATQYLPFFQGTGTTWIANFGQRPFAYTAPSGYKALCTQNLPTPTIGATTATQAGLYFNPVLYTGTGATLSVTGSGFQPDLVWIKQRNGARNHNLYDAVRGTLKVLQANVTDAEVNYAGSLTSFDSNGFSLGTASDVNVNGNTYVAWNWKANGSGSTNTAGSITSTVSANTTSGFSVVTYTGTSANATVGHGLGVAPSMIIVKSRSTIDGWFVYNKEIGNTKYLRLNTTDAASTFNLWQSTSPTSSVFSIATDPTVNLSGATYVAYCFAEVAGYSKIGSYTGNGSADGPFVYCGFKPRYVLFKDSSNATWPWIVVDTARNTYNVMNAYLSPNNSNAEATNFSGNAIIDSLSNGFKLRSSDAYGNSNGDTYIFMAFAESPFKYSLAR